MKRSNILRRKPMDVPSMHEAYEYTENMREACENVCVCNATLATMCRATTSECSYKSVSVGEVHEARRSEAAGHIPSDFSLRSLDRHWRR